MCLPNYKKNKDIILERNNYIFEKFKIDTFKNRIGPVIIIPLDKIKNKEKLKKHLMIRHINTNIHGLDSFKKVFILPIHFMINEKKFLKMVNILDKCIKINEKKNRNF